VSIPANARTIDLGDVTLMPGFIDAHTHLVGRVLGDPEGDNAAFRDFESFAAILSVGNARATLMAGFTSIRNVGAGGKFDDMAWRKAINEGGIEEGIADGPEQVRAAVRYLIKYGADVIKTCATGGVLSEGDAVGATQYTYEELKALVSTLSASESVERAAKMGVLKGLRAEKALAATAAARHAIKLAVANKIPIALGTDAGVVPHGTNAREFVLMVQWPQKAQKAHKLNREERPTIRRFGSAYVLFVPFVAT